MSMKQEIETTKATKNIKPIRRVRILKAPNNSDLPATERLKKPGNNLRKKFVAGSIVGAFILTELGGATIVEFTNDQPASITRTVPEDLKWPITLVENLFNQKTPDTFNNNAGETKFGENNVSRISPEEASEKGLTEPKITIEKNGTVNVTTLLPGNFPAEIKDTKIRTNTDAGEAGVKAPSVEKHFPMPAGFRLPILKGMHYALLQPAPDELKGSDKNPDYIYTIVSFYQDPINNVTMAMTFESMGFIPANGQAVLDRKTYNEKYNPSRGGRLEDLPVSDGITPIAIPASDNQVLDIFLHVISGSYDNKMSINRYLKVKWENILDQNQKLIMVSSK
jgi:hypothetical protein